ncbi:MAG: hypothetical protein QOF48_3075, partial [Verrucomicrobiota bacterium]
MERLHPSVPIPLKSWIEVSFALGIHNLPPSRIIHPHAPGYTRGPANQKATRSMNPPLSTLPSLCPHRRLRNARGLRTQNSTHSRWLWLLALLILLPVPSAMNAATVWTGPALVFTKANSADPTQAANQDRITSNVWLTRGSAQGLYNIAQETAFTHSVSPLDTEWATGTTASYSTLSYTDWESWARSVGNPPNTPGIDAVLHLKTDDI